MRSPIIFRCAKFFILCLACLPLTVQAEEQTAETKLVRVAVFDYPDKESNGPRNLKQFLTPANGFKYQVVRPAEIRNGILKDFDVLIMPGGSGSKQSKALAPEGRKAVRQFVQNGGGYVGICAGAYLASSHYKWSLGVINARVWDRQHWARGAETVEIGLTPAGQQVLARGPKSYKVRYQNGPLLVPDNQQHLPGYEVLASFETEVARNGAPAGAMVGTHAIIRSKFGAGRVICYSPHPEAQDGPKSLVASGVYWASQVD
ncbi:biofilm PGA synthesis protein PgaC [Gimesia chilikensis]|uniref:BPL-N domain-containing protein n=1 Tax=Gimesia chilikensis TaxID=2605989 RepID=UPI0011F0737F|nr:BPL-N domain-containing protein [Gimesia chilikensis]KAA0134264.1 biofilm PGA synthesis protein PgaC [Gimesia chilikensis]